jgi:hypothetical protein
LRRGQHLSRDRIISEGNVIKKKTKLIIVFFFPLIMDFIPKHLIEFFNILCFLACVFIPFLNTKVGDMERRLGEKTKEIIVEGGRL